MRFSALIRIFLNYELYRVPLEAPAQITKDVHNFWMRITFVESYVVSLISDIIFVNRTCFLRVYVDMTLVAARRSNTFQLVLFVFISIVLATFYFSNLTVWHTP